MRVSSLPKAVTWKRTGRGSNPLPFFERSTVKPHRPPHVFLVYINLALTGRPRFSAVYFPVIIIAVIIIIIIIVVFFVFSVWRCIITWFIFAPHDFPVLPLKMTAPARRRCHRHESIVTRALKYIVSKNLNTGKIESTTVYRQQYYNSHDSAI